MAEVLTKEVERKLQLKKDLDVTSQQNVKLPTQKVKVTFLISTADLDLLKGMASNDGVTLTETLRRSIRTEALLREEAAKGYKLFLGNEDGSVRKQLTRWGY